MASVTVGEYNEGDDRHVLVTNAIQLPPMADGTQLEATVVSAGANTQLLIIVLPAAPAAPASATPTRA